MMDRVFQEQIGQNVEVYVNDMIVKFDTPEQHALDLAKVFGRLRKFDMRCNPTNCIFGVEGGKFLDFLLTSSGTEANSDKYKVLEQMRSPQNLKEVQRLIGQLTTLSRFVPSDRKDKAHPQVEEGK